MTPTDDEITEMAKARVGFRSHAIAFVLVNVFLVGVWWFTDRPGAYWPIWVHLGWGLGLGSHAWATYGGGRDALAREEAKLREKYGAK